MKKRALTAYEDTNMYGGAHATNYKTAARATQEARDLIVHARHYDGQRYSSYSYRVYNLRKLADGRIVGEMDNGEKWEATGEICEYARTGNMRNCRENRRHG